jgi:hypothetical protein
LRPAEELLRNHSPGFLLKNASLDNILTKCEFALGDQEHVVIETSLLYNHLVLDHNEVVLDGRQNSLDLGFVPVAEEWGAQQLLCLLLLCAFCKLLHQAQVVGLLQDCKVAALPFEFGQNPRGPRLVVRERPIAEAHSLGVHLGHEFQIEAWQFIFDKLLELELVHSLDRSWEKVEHLLLSELQQVG